MEQTLADRVSSLDEARFCGRQAELQLLDAVLAGETAAQVVLVHGRGGIGKSALLRELARRADRLGFTPRTLDGRELMPVPGEIERAIGDVRRDARPLLIFDSYERMSGADGWIRGTLLPALPDRALVVLASRAPPEEDWCRDGWEHVVLELALAPLGDDDARAMLGAYGVPDGPAADDLLRLAGGWPLPLAMAAGAAGGVPAAGEELDPEALLQAVAARVARSELERGSFDAVAVAAIARSCDARLLASVLPELDEAATMTWLRGLPFSERIGAGVGLHDLVRVAIRSELEGRDAGRARELRRRIADEVHARAIAGEPRMLIDLTELIDDAALRWGLGAEGSVDYRLDAVGPGDAAGLAPWYSNRPQWWRDVAGFLADAPECVVLARDASDDAPAGISIAVALANPPALAADDGVIGPWMQYARDRLRSEDVLLWRDSTDLRRNADPASPIVSLMNTAAILRSGIPNVRYSFIPIDPGNQAAIRFSRAVGGAPIPALATEIDGRPLECHLIDHGAGGMIGQLREIVYAELRLPARPARDGPAASHEDVRDALRNLHRPTALAGSPLARGATGPERAASVRALLHGAVIQAFGDSADELLLREVLERGYFDPDGKHELAAERLNLSRTAYFRRLRTASERLANWLVDAGGDRPA